MKRFFLFVAVVVLSVSIFGSYEYDMYEPLYANGHREFNKTAKLDGEFLAMLVFFQINLERAKYGFLPLECDTQLSEVASSHAAQMVEFDFCSHINQRTEEFKTVQDRYEFFGVDCDTVAENIAVDINIDQEEYLEKSVERVQSYREMAEDLVASMVGEYRKNIFSRQFKSIGTGVSFDSQKLKRHTLAKCVINFK